MALSAEQQRVVRRALAQARKMGASPREKKALVASSAVETNHQHDKYAKVGSGDRDSVGFLQQRPSMGWGPAGESIERDTAQFLRAAKKVNRAGFKGSAGQLAQAVQRSAFPARYDQRGGEADALIRKFGGKGGKSSPGRRSTGTPRLVANTTTTPGVDNSALRQSLKLDYLQKRGKPGALLSLATGLSDARDTPATKKTRYEVKGSAAKPKPKPALNARAGGGRLAGTENKIIPFSQRAHGLGLQTTSGKRPRRGTASGGMSDHYKGNTRATARDWSGPPEKMDRLARSIARELGAKNWKGGVLNVNRNGFRYQLLWKTNVGGDHYGHVHLGVKKL